MYVETHYAGSKLVVWKNERQQHYIDVVIDLRYMGHHRIDVIRNGQVYKREIVDISKAPERIAELMRQELT